MKEGLIRMETEHRENGRRGSLIAAIVGVLLYAAVTAAVVLCYRHAGLSQTGARWLQNGVYFAMLLLPLAAMFRGGQRPRDYGVFFAKSYVQADIGLALGGGDHPHLDAVRQDADPADTARLYGVQSAAGRPLRGDVLAGVSADGARKCVRKA